MSGEEHKKLVKGLIDHFESKGLKIISAAYEGYEKCETIGSHEPDVIAQKPNEERYYIGEAKTCDNLTTERTIEQLQDFANTVVLKPGSERTFLPFCIAVPKRCLDDLKKYIEDFGLLMNENVETIGI